MALDEMLLELKAEEKIPHTLRFLQFSNPSCPGGTPPIRGRRSPARLLPDRKESRSIGGSPEEVPSIGGQEELGWEIYISKNDPRIPSRIEDLYRKMGEALCSGSSTSRRSRPISVREMISRSRAERFPGQEEPSFQGAILFQGTVLVDFDVDEMLRALRIPTEKLQDKEIESVKERVTCLKWELGRTPPLLQIKTSLIKGFEEAFGVTFDHQPLTSEEENLLKAKLPYFSSPDYIFKVRESLPRRKTLTSILKAPGGLIRVSMAVDTKTRVINQILITGDFFAYPKRAIFDLESLLKNSKASPSNIERIIRSFFADRKPQIPGIKEDHLIQAIEEAIQKMDLLPHGFDEEETHHLFPVLKPLER